MKTQEERETIAQDHADWFGELVSSVYYQAFLHGYKHGKEENK